EQPVVVGHVPGPGVVVGAGGGRAEVGPGDALVVAADVTEVDVAGADGDQQRDAVRAVHLQGAAGTAGAAAIGDGAGQRQEPDLAGDAPLVAGDAVDRRGRAVRAG